MAFARAFRNFDIAVRRPLRVRTSGKPHIFKSDGEWHVVVPSQTRGAVIVPASKVSLFPRRG